MSDVMVHLPSKVYYGMLDDAKKQGVIEELNNLLDFVEFHYPTTTREEFVDKLHLEIERRLKELEKGELK